MNPIWIYDVRNLVRKSIHQDADTLLPSNDHAVSKRVRSLIGNNGTTVEEQLTSSQTVQPRQLAFNDSDRSPYPPLLPGQAGFGTAEDTPSDDRTTTNDASSDQSPASSGSVRRYECSGCGAICDAAYRLRRHIVKSHEKSLRCLIRGCDQTPFALSADLRRHQSCRHPEIFPPQSTFQCRNPRCGKKFPRRDNCRRHERKLHNIRS